MEDIFKLLEGVCPYCGGELVIQQVAGYPEFHRDHTFEEGEPDELDDIGCVSFICQGCQRAMEAYRGAYGDWVASV